MIKFPPRHQCGSIIVIPCGPAGFKHTAIQIILDFKQRVKQAKVSQISRRGRKMATAGPDATGGARLKHSLYQDGRNSINIIDQRSGLDSFSHEYVEENGCCFDPLASTPTPHPAEFYIDKNSLDITGPWNPSFITVHVVN